MDENELPIYLPPEEFIRAVLDLYHNRGWPVQDIANRFEVGVEVITRILNTYQPPKSEQRKEIEDKREKKKLLIKEMDDVARKATEKITKEDFADLDLDITLFGKGYPMDEEDKK